MADYEHYDRTIHARTEDGTLVVRYDRAGRWYAEASDGGVRERITLARAVALATQRGSYVYLGRPGGRLFEARVREAVESAPRP